MIRNIAEFSAAQVIDDVDARTASKQRIDQVRSDE